MDFKFSKGPGEVSQQAPPAEKKNQNALLVLLLILVGGFSYLYFFTGLIKPLEVPKPAETPAPPVVKMPLPARDGDVAAVDSKAIEQKEAATPAKVQSANVVQAPPVAPVAPVAKPSAQPPAKPKEEPKKAEPPKVAEKKAQPAPIAEKTAQKVVAKAEDKKNAAEVKPAPADKKVVAAVKPAEKKVVAENAIKHKKSVTVPVAAVKAETGKGTWSLLVGQYVLEEALSTDLGRVRKAGFEPVVKTGIRKKAAMNRLMLAEFADRAGAQAALAKLKHQTSDAFAIEQGGKHIVYAGSYLLDARAASEKERLGAAGFPVTLKHAEIAIPTQSLTVGPFSDKKTADAALGKLKSVGIKATLVPQ